MKGRVVFAACILFASFALAEDAALVCLGGSPAEIGKTWGEINRRVVRQDIEEHYLK